jgi:hypothetical protein
MSEFGDLDIDGLLLDTHKNQVDIHHRRLCLLRPERRPGESR